MPLTANQAEAVRVLDWLLDPSEGYRRTGRSLAIAVVLIRQALRYPGLNVHYLDHVGGLPQVQMLNLCRSTIEGLTQRDPLLRRLNWTFRQRHFSVQLPAETIVIEAPIPSPLHEWWPSDECLGPGGPIEAGEATESSAQRRRRQQRVEAARAANQSQVQATLKRERELDEALRDIQQKSRPSVWDRLGDLDL